MCAACPVCVCGSLSLCAREMWQPPAWATVPTRAVGLEVRRGDELIKTHDLSKRKAYVLGRQVGAVDVHVPDERVSRQHCALVHKGDAMYLTPADRLRMW